MHSSLNLYDRRLNSKLVKLVFPLDSPLTILPLVIIAAILVFYTLLLIKLKPSREDIETTENDSIELKKLEKPTTPTETSESASEAVTPTVKEEPTEAVETEANALNVEVDETIKKNNKDKELKKTFFLFGEREFEGCPHKFGYLKSLRKNAPIPDECFGCPQILECLMTRKSK
jgi:hypothetical protein